jgi:hypothetical protein
MPATVHYLIWRPLAGTDREAGTVRRNDMARINYDDQTAAAFKAVREVPRDGLAAWREAVRRHLRPCVVAGIMAGAGTEARDTAHELVGVQAGADLA